LPPVLGGHAAAPYLENMTAADESVPLVTLLTPTFALVWRVEYFFW
jgi:hypothetical protein